MTSIAFNTELFESIDINSFIPLKSMYESDEYDILIEVSVTRDLIDSEH